MLEGELFVSSDPQVASGEVGRACMQGYREDNKLLLESDADEQMIIHINFMTPVKIQSILFQAPTDGHGPRIVKLFRNRPTIGFSEAEEEEGDHSLELSDTDLEGVPKPLRYAVSLLLSV
jgi:hypothetical protein